jgi:hypothetical protein
VLRTWLTVQLFVVWPFDQNDRVNLLPLPSSLGAVRRRSSLAEAVCLLVLVARFDCDSQLSFLPTPCPQIPTQAHLLHDSRLSLTLP